MSGGNKKVTHTWKNLQISAGFIEVKKFRVNNWKNDVIMFKMVF